MPRIILSAATVALMVAVTLFGATTAAAAPTFVIKGRAWGHGVGMSQYGAMGLAEHGRNYKQILRHYYRGTKIGKAPKRKVRVLVGSGSSIRFRGAERACGKTLRPSKRYRFVRAKGGVAVTKNGRRIISCGGTGAAKGGASVVYEGRGKFRGALLGVASGAGLNAVNRVSIDDYVKGVVPNEVPTSWPAQTLRAQAVAARSYALSTGADGDGFDLYDDTRSQVYGGRASETKPTNRAVRATRREVVKSNGKIATTFFFSTSGGRTENVEHGFLGAEPRSYLKGVRDPYDDASPYHRWKLKLSRSEMESRLGSLVQGRLRKIKVLKTGTSPRIVKARVVGSRGKRTVSGPTLRTELGLRSTWAKFKKRR